MAELLAGGVLAALEAVLVPALAAAEPETGVSVSVQVGPPRPAQHLEGAWLFLGVAAEGGAAVSWQRTEQDEVGWDARPERSWRVGARLIVEDGGEDVQVVLERSDAVTAAVISAVDADQTLGGRVIAAQVDDAGDVDVGFDGGAVAAVALSVRVLAENDRA